MMYKLLALGVFVATGMSFCTNSGGEKPLSYPKFRHDAQTDIYHGVEVQDPFRYLEDPDSEETQKWVQAQNLLTFNYLSNLPERDTIRKRLESIWDYERYGLIFRNSSRYFFTKNNGLQNQHVLYTLDTLHGEPEVLLDPNLFSSDGTVAMSFYAPSEDGNLLAYGISRAGSDWTEIKVLDVNSKEELSDHLEWVKFSSASWLKDGSGFYYARYDKPADHEIYESANYHHKVYFHKLGTSQDQDPLVYENPDHKDWLFHPGVTEDGKYLIISVAYGTSPKNGVLYQDLLSDGPIQGLFTDFDAQYSFIGNDGSLFWFKTDLHAPRGRVVAVDHNLPQEKHWKEVIGEKKETLSDVSLVGNRLIASYLKDAHSQVEILHIDGEHEKTLSLPSMGTVGGFPGKRSDTETFYSFASFNCPTTIYRYDFTTGQSEELFKPTLPISLDDFSVSQIFYNSLDGTKVPMFIISKKGLVYDGMNPVHLVGYGGFDISITPSFSPEIVAWLEMGGVFAVANIRGGGEYGEEWHNAGKLENKQNCFNDFIAASEWLIDQKITSKNKLSISGRSNGGLLVGACMTQRPDLYAAAVPGVGVLDMLRYHKFTIGWAWIPEYGSSDNPDQFAYLYRYSPLHNTHPGSNYPATLILTADHDDRVVPAHSFKFAATLQEAQGSANPILIRIETSAGHGSGKPTAKIIDETADKLAFLKKHLNIN